MIPAPFAWLTRSRSFAFETPSAAVVSGFLTAVALAKAVSRTVIASVVSGFSRTVIRLASVAQPDRVFRPRRTQVHVTFRRGQVRVVGQIIDGSRRRNHQGER
jgi:hypothetical protein